eukprot:4579782-Amphidinium_carterae.1
MLSDLGCHMTDALAKVCSASHKKILSRAVLHMGAIVVHYAPCSPIVPHSASDFDANLIQ